MATPARSASSDKVRAALRTIPTPSVAGGSQESPRRNGHGAMTGRTATGLARGRVRWLILWGASALTLLGGAGPLVGGQTSSAPSPKEAFVVVNGVRLHYVDWGGNGEPLLLLTGLGAKLEEQFDVLEHRSV